MTIRKICDVCLISIYITIVKSYLSVSSIADLCMVSVQSHYFRSTVNGTLQLFPQSVLE